MRRDFINKIIAGTIISTTLCTLVPIKASAEWVNDYQNNKYYMQDGQKLTGWKKIDGNLYYFDNNGKMLTGWLKAENSNYFLQNDGVLKIGWFKYDRNWYYSDSNGAIQTGTLNISGKVYILNDSGIMQTNNTVINGQFYTIGADGAVAGAIAPTPDKEFDEAGNVLAVLKNTESKGAISPTYSSFSDVIKDQSVSNDDPNEGRTFKVRFKDSNGAELKAQNVKNGKSVDLFEPSKTGYIFGSWNTKSDGSGKSYESGDNIKVKEDINLYAQWSKDTAIYVDGIIIKGSSYVTVGKTSQMTAEISPSNAANTGITWSVTDGTGKATIDSNGVLTGVTNGTVTVKATSKDGSKVSGLKEVTVSATDVVVLADKITVTGGTTITTPSGTLQMVASISPDDATNKVVKWKIKNTSGSAEINEDTGLIKAISNGIVEVTATAQDGSGKVGTATITISGQSTAIPVSNVTITTNSNVFVIKENGKTLQLNASIEPTSASNKSVKWSITSAKDKAGNDVAQVEKIAKISQNGLLTPVADGTVTVQAVTSDGSKTATQSIAISGQIIKMSKITITGPTSVSGSTRVTMGATIEGTDATITALNWTVENKTGSASIDPKTLLLTPLSNGLVIVRAAATDGSGVTAQLEVNIRDVVNKISISKFTVATATGATTGYVTKDDETLDFIAAISPTYASTTSAAVTWSVQGGSDGGSAIIDSIDGSKTAKQGAKVTIKAVNNGTVTIKATVTDVNDNSTKTATATLRISNQVQQAKNIVINAPANGGQVGVKESLLLTAKVTGGDTKYQTVQWNVSNLAGDTGVASFDTKINGLLKATEAGTVTVTAISTDGYNTPSVPMTITVVDPPVLASTFTMTSPEDTITNNKGTLTLTAAVDTSATSNVVTWSVVPITGKASIVDNHDSTATITASENGDVKVIATASGGKTVEKIITISGQDATGITVSSASGESTINKLGDTLQMVYNLSPSSSTTPASVTWSVSDKSKAEIVKNIDGTAQLKAVDNGDVTVTATVTTANGVTLTDSKVITIAGVKSIIISKDNLTVSGGSFAINNGDKVTLTAIVLPSNVKNGTVAWSVDNQSIAGITLSLDTKTAYVSASGTGTVKVTATANGDTRVSSITTITIK